MVNRNITNYLMVVAAEAEKGSQEDKLIAGILHATVAAAQAGCLPRLSEVATTTICEEIDRVQAELQRLQAQVADVVKAGTEP